MNIIFLKNIYKFRKCRSDPYSTFILNALISLNQNFFDNHSKIFLFLFISCFVKIHKYCNERSLTICSQKSYNLILNSLNATFNFITYSNLYNLINFIIRYISNTCCFKFFDNICTNLFTTYIYKRSKISQSNRLSTVLIRSNLCNNLSSNITSSGETVRFLNQGSCNNSAILKHIIKVYKITVSCYDTTFKEKCMSYRFFYTPYYIFFTKFDRYNFPKSICIIGKFKIIFTNIFIFTINMIIRFYIYRSFKDFISNRQICSYRSVIKHPSVIFSTQYRFSHFTILQCYRIQFLFSITMNSSKSCFTIKIFYIYFIPIIKRIKRSYTSICNKLSISTEAVMHMLSIII